jgi:transcriptional regulator with XRE-family HTH domain
MQASPKSLCYSKAITKGGGIMTLGEKIRQIRSEKGLSQAALEKISGVNSKLLSKYENERIVPTADTLKKIAEALEVSADYLIFDNAPKSGTSKLTDLELFEKFLQVEKMTPENRNMIKNLIDAVIIKSKVEDVIKPTSEDPWEARMKKTLTKFRKRAKGYSEEEIMKIVDKAVEEVRIEEKENAH